MSMAKAVRTNRETNSPGSFHCWCNVSYSVEIAKFRYKSQEMVRAGRIWKLSRFGKQSGDQFSNKTWNFRRKFGNQNTPEVPRHCLGFPLWLAQVEANLETRQPPPHLIPFRLAFHLGEPVWKACQPTPTRIRRFRNPPVQARGRIAKRSFEEGVPTQELGNENTRRQVFLYTFLDTTTEVMYS